MTTNKEILKAILLVLCVVIHTTHAGLVARFTFDGNLLDSSGNGYLSGDGTLYGDTHYVAGVSGQALEFDGDQDFVQAMVAPDGRGGWIPQRIENQSAVSIAMWVKMDAYPTTDTDLIATRAWNPGDHSIEFNQNVFDWQTPFFIVAQGNWITEYPRQSVATEILGNWFHLVVTYDAVAGQAFLYIDGVAGEKSPITSGSVVTIGNYTIGGGAGFNHRYFDGQIDEVRIYDYALSQAEVQILFHEFDGFDGVDNQCGGWGCLPGDLNRDGQVDLSDLAILASDWLKCTQPEDLICQAP